MTILGFAAARADAETLAAFSRYASVPAKRVLRSFLLASIDGSQGACAAPFVHSADGVTVAVKGDPRFAPAYGPAPTDPAAAIHKAYQERGRDVLTTLVGAFALAIHDHNRNTTLLAIDRMGIERMAYAVGSQMLVFGDSAEWVARFPSIQAGIRKQGVYDFLMMHMIPAPNTIFEGVRKLQPATALVFEHGRAEVFTYWRATFQERGGESFEALRDELHASLDAAVKDCQPDATTGAFLSGGLDSSTVAGKLGHVTGKPARTFSIGFGVEAYDELAYADIAAKHFGCDALQYHVTPEDVVQSFPLIAKAYDEPFGNSSAVPAYYCALRAREHGIEHLLAGDGGDEIFGGNERYARQQVFDLYFRIPGFVRKGILEPLAVRIPAGTIKPLNKFKSYVEQARIPLPERLESWNFMYREGRSMLEPDFAASVNQRFPFEVMNEVYSAAPCNSTLNKMLYYDWQFTLADSDLRKVNTMCELAGVRVSYPMLDQRVVDLANRVPPKLKMERLELRSFYKNAMRGFLPNEILTKTKHGFGLPFGDWLKSHAPLADLIYGLLSDLKARRIVRPKFLDELIDNQRRGHAMYYGYAIWDLAMLEAWLQAHTQR
jgi:asparagine synthase (glutamine-hydrolysing)